jgi:hypothetical protein
MAESPLRENRKSPQPKPARPSLFDAASVLQPEQGKEDDDLLTETTHDPLPGRLKPARPRATPAPDG